MPMPVPLSALGSRRESAEGIEVAFTSTLAPVIFPVFVVLAGALSLSTRDALPLILPVALLPAYLQPRWAFCYLGPSVRHTRTLFGVPLWRRVYALEDSDTASVDVIEDTIFLTQRPRWYTLSLWSSALSKDLVVLRSNDPEELRRIASILNAAIADVRAKAVRLG